MLGVACLLHAKLFHASRRHRSPCFLLCRHPERLKRGDSLRSHDSQLVTSMCRAKNYFHHPKVAFSLKHTPPEPQATIWWSNWYKLISKWLRTILFWRELRERRICRFHPHWRIHPWRVFLGTIIYLGRARATWGMSEKLAKIQLVQLRILQDFGCTCEISRLCVTRHIILLLCLPEENVWNSQRWFGAIFHWWVHGLFSASARPARPPQTGSK